MTFNLHQILASKRAYRHALAARDIVEKLAMLDELRARFLTLRPKCEADSDQDADTKDAEGIAACSRWLSEAIPPVHRPMDSRTPEGCQPSSPTI